VVAAYASDLVIRYFGSKPYLSWISGIILLLAFLTCGTMMRSLKTTLGRLGLAFAVWLLIAIPFSRWPGGSFSLMEGFLPRVQSVIFFSGALLLTVKQCRTTVLSVLVALSAILFSCLRSGNMDTGRLYINDSGFFDNPNDLGLFLVVFLGFWAYPLMSKRVVARVVGGVGALITVYYLMKTGSRGSFVALAVVLAACVILSKNRILALAFLIPSVAMTILVAPGNTLHRLALLVTDSEADFTQADDLRSIDSQVSRQELLRLSIKYTIANPIFGVGSGQFSDSVWSDSKKEGIHRADLSTHNGYTQISSENGIPAVCIFISIILLTIRNNFRVYRSMARLHQDSLSRMAFAVMMASIAMAVNLMFHHVGYTIYLPTLVGLTVALEMAVRELPAPEAAPKAPQMVPALA
jgi:O-antigen ligase